MQLIRRFRIPALFCALAVLLCELVAHPYANMGVGDESPYFLMAQTLAATGHIVYNGWAAPMLGWQLYLASALIKLFGFSFTTVRTSTLLVSMALAFVLQRTLVRAGISERNATIGTLALVLSPLYLLLSATFMSDIHGLFAIVLCLYGCLRALQSSTSRAAIAWLCFAVAANAICGSSRQIAWLGILVMVPSTLWLLRAQRRVLLAGAAATLAGALFIFACMLWLQHQPYHIPEHLLPDSFPLLKTLAHFIYAFLDVPFLLLPIAALFLPDIRKSRPRVIATISVLVLGYLLLATCPSPLKSIFHLEPTLGDWVDPYGIYDGGILPQGKPPLFLHEGVQVFLTLVSLGSLLCLIASFLDSRETSSAAHPPSGISWKQLGVLVTPFTIAYTLLLLPQAAPVQIFDRYLLALLLVALPCLVRYYQDRIQPQFPSASILLIGILAIYGIAVTHNTFALYRARVALAAELRANGVPDTSVDNGWEYNFGVELQHAASLNDSRIEVPAHAYIPMPPLPAGPCKMWWYDKTPHIHARYRISPNPNTCRELAPFAPITYSRWLATPGTLYVVNYPSKQ